MSANTKKLSITFLGDCYTILTDEPEEHIQEAALLVNTAMQEIQQKALSMDDKKVACLAALKIASKVCSLERTLEKEQKQFDELLKMLECITEPSSMHLQDPLRS